MRERKGKMNGRKGIEKEWKEGKDERGREERKVEDKEEIRKKTERKKE
jgi:hypothetical protein